MSAPPSHLFSTIQAAERLGISREHVRRLILRGELHAKETVNGFMLDANEVEQYAVQRRILQDQRQFRAAVDDLAAKARRISEAAGVRNTIAQVRDQMKRRSALDVPAAVAQQVMWLDEQIGTQETLAALIGPVQIVVEQWRCYSEDARRAAADGSVAAIPANAAVVAGIPGGKPPMEERTRLAGSARGFVVTEPREARLEQKVDELSRKVEQLTELVAQQRPGMRADVPTWQRWAGSDRPEVVLAKLDAIREEATGGKQAEENSTEIVRKSRGARGGDA